MRQSRPRRVSRRHGFTLAELLVVIGAMIVLAALLLPVLARAQGSARRASCLAHLRQIVLAHQLYLQDWDERFSSWCTPVPRRSDPYGFCVYWTEWLGPYLRHPVILHDPGAREKGFDGIELAEYVLLTWGPLGRGTRGEPYFRWPGPPLSLARVARPAENIQLADGWTTTGGAVVDGWLPVGTRTGNELRHDGGMNAAMVDGHARWLPEDEFWRVKTDGRGFYWLQYAAADR
jgi:prepilin-type processing-associated H-X9-DG protein